MSNTFHSKCSSLNAHLPKARCWLLEDTDPVAHMVALMDQLKDYRNLCTYPAPVGDKYSENEKRAWTNRHYGRLESTWRSKNAEPLVTTIRIQSINQTKS